MRYYPINLDLINRRCLVVGGGSVGARKASNLVKCGAKVTVVSPKINHTVMNMFKQNLIVLKRRNYESSDILNRFLVVGATSDEALNRTISEEATKYNILCNIVDKPELCNFILPAILSRGDFMLSISTAGKSPALAKKVRQELETMFGPEYSLLLKLMGSIRLKLLNGSHRAEQHKFLFEKLLEDNLLGLIKNENIAAIDSVLHSVLGPSYNYNELI